ncbi:MAG: antibiotic biosynthesis monooxygenase [Rhizobiales bacterium]|nr:antibiotic biosynthesis monooxygenase [Hyphomicrobiales bacterium]MBO6700500.1 antibiotic biosynthesis monooxygenase [Hyphomicrobiales bacterium]MBO6738036.1 antibiotic biosynthesis monooxygenase [Hyphomicrobiales bacterium]MBO6913657.1 antibiotic biosynthesis monooxygenase [Hyphomicrobiales bacterium]MBO6954446.1 antibiotic biosynthesis monooxygenase [Hyphomicrobiales bacterium]
MIVEYLRYTIDAERQAAFIEAYKKAEPILLSSPYALAFELCQCVEDPSQFIIRIEWTSAEDHLQKFRGSQVFRDFFGCVRPFLGDIAEMRHYSAL